jgi:hypothetical protein
LANRAASGEQVTLRARLKIDFPFLPVLSNSKSAIVPFSNAIERNVHSGVNRQTLIASQTGRMPLKLDEALLVKIFKPSFLLAKLTK